MPTIFSFEQGREDRSYATHDASPLLGRYRAVPRRQLSGSGRTLGTRGSVHFGYGSTTLAGLDLGDEEGDNEESSDSEAENEDLYSEEGRLARLGWRLRRFCKMMDHTWINPTPRGVRKVVRWWWRRWFVLVVLPAALVSLHNEPPGLSSVWPVS
jgi:hypothetical protein